MKPFELWDRKSPINEVNASHILGDIWFKTYEGDIILIYTDDKKRVTNIERKDMLSEVYGVNIDLPVDEFMAQVFEKIDEINAERKREGI